MLTTAAAAAAEDDEDDGLILMGQMEQMADQNVSGGRLKSMTCSTVSC